MSDRLSDERVAGICGHGQGRSDYVLLAREVLASRKLIADLRALVTDQPANVIAAIPSVGAVEAAVLRLIDEAGL